MRDPHWTSGGRDAYDILGVDQKASKAEIRRAYRRLSQRHHPDAGGQGEEQIRLNLAYHTLSDPQRRAAYDRARAPSPPTPPPPPPQQRQPPPPAQPTAAEFQWTSGTGSTDPPRSGSGRPPGPPPAPASTEPDTDPGTDPGADAVPEPELGPILTAFVVPALLVGAVLIIFAGVEMTLSFGGIVLTLLALAIGIFAFIGATSDGPAPPPGAVAVAQGVGLAVGVVAGLAGWVVLGRFSGLHAGVMVVAWLGALTTSGAYAGMARAFSQVGRGMVGVACWSGLLLFTLLAGFVAAVVWVGELSGWHSGVIWLMWTGMLVTAVGCAVAISTLGNRGQLRFRRLLTSSLFPVGIFGAGVAVTAGFGIVSGWHAGGISLFWVVVAVMNLTYAGVRSDQPENAQ